MNDDKIANWPDIGILSIGVSRAKGMGDLHHPFPEYHTSDDDIDLVSGRSLEEARDLVLEMRDALALDYTPVPLHRGPVFLSRYGLFIDWQTSPELNPAQEAIMAGFDGHNSDFDIARKLGLDFKQMLWFTDRFVEKDLVERKPPVW